MVLIGLLLILLAIAAGAWLFLGTQSLTTPIDLDTPGYHVSATPLALVVSGAVVLLLLWLGLAAIRGSVKRRRRPAREAKEAQRQAEFEENIRADERARADEAHQGSLAERDRVRDEEFQAKLAERDRIRDAEERTRLSEHEQRVRADERGRLEQQFRQRQEELERARGAGSGQGDHVGTGGAVGGVAAGADFDPTDDTVRHGRHETVGPDHGADHGADQGTDGPGRDGVYDQASDPDGAGFGDQSAEAGAGDGADEGDGHSFRTVADKIMGRGPTGHD